MKYYCLHSQYFTIPKGAHLFPSITPLDSLADAQVRVIDGASLVVGEIPVETKSFIFLHPVISQMTWVLSGKIQVLMNVPPDAPTYTLEVSASSAPSESGQSKTRSLNL